MLFRSPEANDPTRFDGQQVILQRLVYLSPSVAYKLSDTLSVGLAIPIAHQSFALNTDMRFPNKLLGIIGKLQDAWCGEGGNPLDTFGFGLCGGGKEGRLRPRRGFEASARVRSGSGDDKTAPSASAADMAGGADPRMGWGGRI